MGQQPAWEFHISAWSLRISLGDHMVNSVSGTFPGTCPWEGDNSHVAGSWLSDLEEEHTFMYYLFLPVNSLHSLQSLSE